MIVAILLALALVLALLAVWVKNRRTANGPYVLLESLLDNDELRLAQLLEQAADGRYRLLSRVRLDSMLAVELAPRSKGWRQANFALQGLSADFLLCDRNYSPLLVVASTPERRLLDLCQQVGLPLLAVDARRSYTVEERGKDALKKIAEVLSKQSDINIAIEGHTDSIPYANSNSPINSNWDLSVMRASSVTKLMVDNYGVNPARVTPIGRSRYSPVESNSTPEGRSKNRRIDVILEPDMKAIFSILNNTN